MYAGEACQNLRIIAICLATENIPGEPILLFSLNSVIAKSDAQAIAHQTTCLELSSRRHSEANLE
jgi:hypothetical protein